MQYLDILHIALCIPQPCYSGPCIPSPCYVAPCIPLLQCPTHCTLHTTAAMPYSLHVAYHCCNALLIAPCIPLLQYPTHCTLHTTAAMPYSLHLAYHCCNATFFSLWPTAPTFHKLSLCFLPPKYTDYGVCFFSLYFVWLATMNILQQNVNLTFLGYTRIQAKYFELE